MKLSKSYKDLVAAAETNIRSLTPAEVKLRSSEEGVLLIDLRDIREVKREGKIAGAFHVPRGMLEFWIDPQSPYYQPRFDNVEEVILYCNKGWRSALAAQTLQGMGAEKVCHMSGGMERWAQEGGAIEKE